MFNVKFLCNYHSRKTCAVSWAVPHHSMSMGNFGALLCPRGTTYTPLRSMFSHSLIASSNVVIHMFLRNSRSELRPSKLAAMLSLWDFSDDFFAPCTIIVHPIAYKRYSTPFLNRPHDLTPHSWVCDKRCRRSSEPKFCPEEEE